jgi:predicted RNA-binding Zn ribbon-like protein
VSALAVDLGLTDATEGDEDALARVLDLRADLYATITGIAPASRIARLDAVIRAGRRDLEFRGIVDGVPQWVPRATGPDAVLHAFGRSIGDLLSRPQRIGVCPRCGWAFLDPSGRRKWCSMKWCGNRDKVQQFALRAKAGAGPA